MARTWTQMTVSMALLAVAGDVSAQSRPAERVMDRVVAIAEGQVITLSELEFEARVALVQQGGTAAASSLLDDNALAAALSLGISQRLEVNEGERLRAFNVEEPAVKERLQQFEARIGGKPALDAFLARNEADQPQLEEVLARALRAEQVLDSKIRLRVQVSEADVRRVYEDRKSHGLDVPYEEMRASLRDELSRERYLAAARREMLAQRQSANVRLIAPFTRRILAGGAP